MMNVVIMLSCMLHPLAWCILPTKTKCLRRIKNKQLEDPLENQQSTRKLIMKELDLLDLSAKQPTESRATYDTYWLSAQRDSS